MAVSDGSSWGVADLGDAEVNCDEKLVFSGHHDGQLATKQLIAAIEVMLPNGHFGTKHNDDHSLPA